MGGGKDAWASLCWILETFKNPVAPWCKFIDPSKENRVIVLKVLVYYCFCIYSLLNVALLPPKKKNPKTKLVLGNSSAVVMFELRHPWSQQRNIELMKILTQYSFRFDALCFKECVTMMRISVCTDFRRKWFLALNGVMKSASASSPVAASPIWRLHTSTSRV